MSYLFEQSTKQAAKQPAECEVSYPNLQDFASYSSGPQILDFYVCIRKNAYMYVGADHILAL